LPCWKCGLDDPLMNAYKYCTDCGARLVQVCMYCRKDIPVQARECPHCGCALLRCRTHYILYDLEQTRCEIPGCEEELVYSSEVFLPHTVDLSRLNHVRIDKRVGRLSCTHFNAPVSPMIIINTRGYYWKAGRGQSKLCCYDFTKGPQWPDDVCPTAEFFVRGDAVINFELFGVYLVTSLSDRVFINLLNDGKPVAQVPVVAPEYLAWMLRSRLFILSRDQSATRLVYYDPPYNTHSECALPGVNVNANDDAAVVLPAIDNGRAYFVNYDGTLAQTGFDGRAGAIYTPRGGSKIGYLAVSNGYAIFSLSAGLNSAESLHELRRLDIETKEESPIVDNLHLACAKLAICNDSVFTCEREAGGGLYFYEYPLTGGYALNPYTRRWRISRAAEIYDFYLAICDGVVYFYYISHSDSYNLIEACCMNGAGTSERLKPMNFNSQCGMVNVYNHTILADRSNGQIFAVKAL